MIPVPVASSITAGVNQSRNMQGVWLNLEPAGSFKSISKRDSKQQSTQTSRPEHGFTFPFDRLPAELQLHVLSLTDLAPQNEQQQNDGAVELRMVQERLRVRRPFASTASDGLFMASKMLRDEALEILLSRNKLVLLDCDCTLPDPSCAQLSLQLLRPRLLCRVPSLTLRIQLPWLLDRMQDDRDGVLARFIKNWAALIGFVGAAFDLGQLELTIDASWEYDMILEMGIPKERLDRYTALYLKLAEPLSNLKGLKSLRVLLACQLELEEKIVQKVTGDRPSELKSLSIVT